MLVDVRVIASTNKTVEEALRKGELREDLFYRLNVFQIHLPPLREREGDLPLLAESLIRDLNRKHGCKVTDVGKEAMDQLRRHFWPGNVRELRNVLERAVIIAGEGIDYPGPPAARLRNQYRVSALYRTARHGFRAAAGRHDGR